MHPIVFEFKSAIDHYPLVGHLFSSSSSKPSSSPLNKLDKKDEQQEKDSKNLSLGMKRKINYVIINCATGIHQTFYLSFAKFLAGQSENVIVFTYDYRGMGKSRNTEKPIQKDVSYLDFAKDFWGMLEHVKEYHSQHASTCEMELTVVGHSIGAYLLMTCPPHLGKLVNRAFLASSYHAYFGYSSPFRNWESLWNYINVRLFFYSIPILSYLNILENNGRSAN
ncbi:alpha/beta hydrolase [Naegleria gruberi]|uniref:Alpha/beta hydrolase n=1 Tax=Naegleria gruberi TaxID=5762 RepID=D2W0U8_NAEGR|nr:alpha/beta hydrolase [Naegleria gruberi]EFC37400.1 alpha/beta hydrolase [Naegleria gruberi]|eukprot:XP_002670144.1 alpha/beta hydrolase [Naegleria gruberi strain NEG-M]